MGTYDTDSPRLGTTMLHDLQSFCSSTLTHFHFEPNWTFHGAKQLHHGSCTRGTGRGDLLWTILERLRCSMPVRHRPTVSHFHSIFNNDSRLEFLNVLIHNPDKEHIVSPLLSPGPGLPHGLYCTGTEN